MMKRLIVLCIILWFPQISLADTHYVTTVGIDTGTCTILNPCASIEYALTGNRMESGDILLLGAGIYDAGGEDGRVFLESGSANRILTDIVGTGIVTVREELTGTVELRIPVGTITAVFYPPIGGGLKLENIMFTNPHAVVAAFGCMVNNRDLSVENCIFDANNVAQYPFLLQDNVSASSFTAYRCDFKNSTARALIRNDSASSVPSISIKSCTGYNLNGVVNSPNAAYLTETNNTFDFSIANPTNSISGTGYILQIENNIMIAGEQGVVNPSILSLADATSLDMIANPNNYTIKNNVFFNYLIETESFGDVEAELMSLVFSNYLLDIDPSNIFVNPSFADYANQDYFLLVTSWAAGRGDATALPDLDREGVAWTGADVGAFANPPVRAVSLSSAAFIGDSIMNGIGADVGSKNYEVFANLTSIQAKIPSAIGGIQSQGTQWLVDYVMSERQPMWVFLSSGINNITTAKPTNWNAASLAATNANTMHKIARWGGVPIWLGITPEDSTPTNADAVNALMSATCADNEWSFANLSTRMQLYAGWATHYYDDVDVNVHPNNAGHTLIAQMAAEALQSQVFKQLYFNASAPDGGYGSKTKPYNAWTDYDFNGYNLRAGAEIFFYGKLGNLDISGLTDDPNEIAVEPWDKGPHMPPNLFFLSVPPSWADVTVTR